MFCFFVSLMGLSCLASAVVLSFSSLLSSGCSFAQLFRFGLFRLFSGRCPAYLVFVPY